jgi:glutamate-1-semialdehyde 2,1-aminomutase
MTEDALFESYRKSHAKSGELHNRAVKYFTGSGATAFVRILEPYRPYITRAKGSKKWDVDGNEYIDYTMGHGALILGHGHPAVVAAVREQAEKGFHYGDNHPLEVEWAEQITRMVPSAERVEFFSCGQEANLMAIRLSRIFTGREKVLRFVENFHGWADQVAQPPTAPGVMAGEVTIIPYDLNRAEEELATGSYAIVMTEGGGAHLAGQVPVDFDFVRALPGLARQYGSIWHLDEVVTGFRDHVGGFQALVGVKPDLTSFGKIVSGGLPGGVLAGRADILAPFSPDMPEEKRVKHSGTWNANPISCVAGIETLKLIEDGAAQKRVNALSQTLRKRGNQMIQEKGVEAWLYGRSITHVYFGPIEMEPADETVPPTADVDKIVSKLHTKERLCLHLIQRGVSTLAGRAFIMSAVHTEEDIDRTVSALGDSIDAMKAEGLL